MKRVIGIENLIISLVSIVIIGSALTPDNIEGYFKTHDKIGYVFHPFWNYTFPIINKLAFTITLFLLSRNLSKELFQPSSKKLKIVLRFGLKVLLLISLITFLTNQFDHSVLVEISQTVFSTSWNRWLLLQVPLTEENAVLITIIMTGSFVLKSTVYLSLYFLIRNYFLQPKWRYGLKKFIKINKKDLSIIFGALYVLFTFFIILQIVGAPIIPYAFIILLLIIPAITGTCISFNIFWFYPSNKSLGRFSKTLLNIGLHLCASGILVGLFFSTIGMGSVGVDISFTISYISVLLICFVCLFLFSHAVSFVHFMIRRKSISANAKLMMELERKGSELSLLKSQINPHFLFNSLNTVYGLALEEESPKAAEGVQKLSEMMRFMLQENTADKIPLEREIKYIHDYIDFQRLRITDKENVDLDIEIMENCTGQIAPMLLIPMIENAFKHGISLQAPSWIKVVLAFDQNEVSLNVQNSMHPKVNRKSEESGIGLENVRKRLDILYPQQHIFQLFENDDSFEANIKVTLS